MQFVKSLPHCVFPRTLEREVLLGLFRFGLVQIDSVVGIALDLLDKLIGLLGLAVPLLLAHLLFLEEEFDVGLAVAATDTVPECGELAVIEVEVQVVLEQGSVGMITPACMKRLTIVWHAAPLITTD